MNSYKFKDIEIGLEKSLSIKVNSTKLDKFLEILRDVNLLHADSEYSKSKDNY
tara:strand:- start:1207 stop:1365 length:159 start_codon:yes stop_codon:yes gene_type:complete